MSDISIPPPGEAQVRKQVAEHKDWHVFSTDYKKENNGHTVIFYLETTTARKFKDLDGEIRVVPPLFVATFPFSRVNREPDVVARQLINTANTMLAENMRAVQGK